MEKCHAVLLDAGSLGLDDLDWRHLEQAFDTLDIYDFTEPERVDERIADADTVLTNKTVLGAEHFARASLLKHIIILATGTNNVDLDAAAEAGIRVSNNRDYATGSVVEHTVMLMLCLARRLPQYLHRIAAGDWQRSRQFCLLEPTIQPIHGRTLGIIGLGASGRGVAQAAQALGMEVVALESPRGSANDDPVPRRPLDELLEQSDIVSIHCPLTPDTSGLLNRDNLQRMKPEAVLINTARGGIVTESDLVKALDKGWIAGAAVDVLTTEPPRDGNPLLECDHPNLIVTPHAAWGSTEARQKLIDQTVHIATVWRQRGEAINCVN